MEKNKINAGTYYGTACLLGAWRLAALGIYGPFIEFAGAGASVPLIGFGHSLWLGVKEAITNEGFIGIFKGGFSASAIGISASLLLGYIASLIFNPKADV